MLKYLVFCALLTSALALGDEDIRCVAKSCDDTTCSAVPAKCTSNVTNAGVYMLSPDICNCCDYCLVNIAEGDPCSVGDPSNAKHTSICGPGLSCVVEKDGQTDGTCQKMTTECTLEQQDYDSRREQGLLGFMEVRATCDDDGNYGKYKCIPGQTCYCLRPNGTRLFGDADYNTIPDYMSCACSRAYSDAVDVLGRELHPHEHFRCTAEGSFDRVQCINEKCLCVDAVDGAPTYPSKDLVNITNINNETLPCYPSGPIYKVCEEEYMKVYNEVQAKKESGYSLILGYDYPNCDLDGTYAAVQENKTHKYCVDKSGTLLNTPINKKESAAESMDCKCARANTVMSTAEKPTCLENGNYNPVQCRRGVCRCVDTDGNQKCTSTTKQCDEVDESQANTLKCT